MLTRTKNVVTSTPMRPGTTSGLIVKDTYESTMYFNKPLYSYQSAIEALENLKFGGKLRKIIFGKGGDRGERTHGWGWEALLDRYRYVVYTI